MSIKDRLSLGRLGTLIPTGDVVRVGGKTPPRGIAGIVEYGDARTIKLIVRQNEGAKPRSKRGNRTALPGTFTAEEVDAAFLRQRAEQLGRSDVAVARMSGDGWYGGRPEASVTYDMVFIRGPHEPTFATFQHHVDDLAQSLADRFGLDRVLMLGDDGAERTVAAASRNLGER